MVIDFHTHAFPEKISGHALDVLIKNSGNVEPHTNGTASGIIEYLDKNKVDKAVVLNIATNPRQQHNVNDFAASINGERLIAFGSVHPDAPDAIDELYRIKELGLKGIKFHPEYQDFYSDDDKMTGIYETAEKLGLIVSFHTGIDIGYPEPVHNTPARMAQAISAFPSGRVVAAHMGGWEMWEETEKHLVGKNLYFDTAFCYSRIPFSIASRIVKNHGADKILLGSDMPWSGTYFERRLVESFDLTPEDKAGILGENAAKLLGI